MATEKLKVYCRGCGKDTYHTVRSKPVDETSSVASGGVGGESGEIYWIVACAGCNTVSFRELVPNDGKDVVNVYPAPTIRKAKEDFESPISRVPPAIRGIYRATMSAYNSGRQNPSSFILCAGGIRCMLELICTDLGIEGRTLEDKIAGLNEAEHLTAAHTHLLQDARFLGNDALHGGIVPAEAPLDALLKLLEDTVNDLYIRTERFTEGDTLDVVVTDVTETGTEVRVGKSTRSVIPASEGGGPPSDNVQKAPNIGDWIKVKVLSGGRDTPLLLSKREADAAIKKKLEDQRIKAEAERAYRDAFRRIKRFELLDGVVTKLFTDGVDVTVIIEGVSIVGGLPKREYDPRLKRRYRLQESVKVLVIEVESKDERLILSHREGIRETYYLGAEDAFCDGGVLRGLVTEIAKDGAKVFVEIGPGCVGQVLQSELGAGYDDVSRVGELRNQKIPVQVTNAPDLQRRAPLQLSHRLALERQQRLTALKEQSTTTPLIGKVSRVFHWGAIVSVNGMDGVMLKVNMAGHNLNEADEIPIEIIELVPQNGYLGLKAAVAAGVPAGADLNVEPSDEMADDADMEEANLQPSGRFQAGDNDPADRLNDEGGSLTDSEAASGESVPKVSRIPPEIKSNDDVPGTADLKQQMFEAPRSPQPAQERPPITQQVVETKVPQYVTSNPQPPTTTERVPATPTDDSVVVVCPNADCKTKLRVKRIWSGKQIPCPKCKTHFVVSIPADT